MSSYAVINLKSDHALKKQALELSEKLGISLSAVLNNELRRFVKEKSVSFEIIEAPNAKTAKSMKQSKKEIEAGDYHFFDDVNSSIDFLKKTLS